MVMSSRCRVAVSQLSQAPVITDLHSGAALNLTIWVTPKFIDPGASRTRREENGIYNVMPSPTSTSTTLAAISRQIHDTPYDPELYLTRGNEYLKEGLPDLASGDAYKALLLLDYVEEYVDGGELEWPGAESTELVESDDEEGGEVEGEDEDSDEEERPDFIEFHAASSALPHLTDASHVETLTLQTLRLLTDSLLAANCVPDAAFYADVAVSRFSSTTPELAAWRDDIKAKLAAHIEFPSKCRRFVYPWNTHEPDRYAPETISYINQTFVAPSTPVGGIEVAVVDLPILSSSGAELGTVKQLGVFATRDLYPGETVLEEQSPLTIITDPSPKSGLCECCSGRYRNADIATRASLSLDPSQKKSRQPSLKAPEPVYPTETYSCDDCVEAEEDGIDCIPPTWCSTVCRDLALSSYHPAICGRPIASLFRTAASKPAVSKKPTTSTPNGAVYNLLLLKTFALALTQEIHPLELSTTKYLYGVPPADAESTMPWSFQDHIVKPLEMLDKLNVDIFSGAWRSTKSSAHPGWFDSWVVNTLIAKYRGVASGRMGDGGVTEAAGCQVVYSMANHSCEPGVQWDLGGRMKFKVLEQKSKGEGEVVIRKGQEVLSCYCDRRMEVGERREWMIGVLGGLCLCERCRREAGEVEEVTGKLADLGV